GLGVLLDHSSSRLEQPPRDVEVSWLPPRPDVGRADRAPSPKGDLMEPGERTTHGAPHLALGSARESPCAASLVKPRTARVVASAGDAGRPSPSLAARAEHLTSPANASAAN